MNDSAHQQEARRAALYFGALVMIGFGSGIPMLLGIGVSIFYCVIAFVVGAMEFAIAISRPQLPRRASLVIFAVTIAVISFCIWKNIDLYNTPDRPSSAFAEQKIVVIAIALLAPSEMLGVALIAGVTGLVVAQYSMWPVARITSAPLLEPWQTVVIGGAALGMLHARRRHVRLMEELARVRTEATWVKRAARLSMSVRDIANSPLQTLQLGAELVRAEGAPVVDILDRLDRAISRLSDLNRALAPLASLCPPPAFGFDAVDDLEREIASSLRGRAEGPRRTAMLETIDPRREAARAALWFSWICATVGLVFALMLEREGLPHDSTLLVLAGGLCGLGLFVIRPNLPRAVSLLVITVQATLILVAVWIGVDAQARSGLPFSPYGGLKFAMIMLMLVVPSLVVGGAILGVATLLPLVQTALSSAAVHARMPLVEPWLTVNLGLVMMAVLYVRRRQVTMIRVAAAELAESAWLARLARLSLLVRDLSKEPLEVVRAATSHLAEAGARKTTVTRMEAARRRLVRINDLLAPLEPFLPARSDADSLDVIEVEVRTLMAQVTSTAPP
jgi:hypothetical protein